MSSRWILLLCVLFAGSASAAQIQLKTHLAGMHEGLNSDEWRTLQDRAETRILQLDLSDLKVTNTATGEIEIQIPIPAERISTGSNESNWRVVHYPQSTGKVKGDIAFLRFLMKALESGVRVPCDVSAELDFEQKIRPSGPLKCVLPAESLLETQ